MSAYSDLILGTSGLVAYWRLGESSGTTAFDEVGSLDGTNTGGVVGQTGALTGDADTCYQSTDANPMKIVIANHASLQLNAGSVEVWFKTADAGASYRGLVAMENAYNIFLEANNIGWYDFGGGGMQGSGVDPTDDAWHHAVLVFDSGVSNGTKLYLDTAVILTGTLTNAALTSPLVISGYNAGGTGRMPGFFDEVAVYNTKLSPTDIAAHYDLGINGPPAGSSRIRTQFELRPY